MSFHFKSWALAAAASFALTACVESGGTTGAGFNKNVLIANQTGRTIWRFYGSPVSTNFWEEDILGSTVLSNGETVNIDFADGRPDCQYDLKAEFQDGTSIVQNNVNVCAVTSVTFR